MTRPLALLLLAGVCGAQQMTSPSVTCIGSGDTSLCSTGVLTRDNVPFKGCRFESAKIRKVAEESLSLNRKLQQSLNTCHEAVMQAVDAVTTCEIEANKPHLPLGVNPGDCFEVQADMSLKMIPCPKEQQ